MLRPRSFATVVILAGVLAAGALVASVRTQTAPAAPAAAPDPAPTDYTRDIQPLLATHCYECHGPKKARGRLRLDLKARALGGGETGPAIVPGHPDDSLVIRRVLGLDDEDRMPLDEDPLSDVQIATLRAWIAGGAPWPEDEAAAAVTSTAPAEPDHWAYRRLIRPAPPEVTGRAWVRNPVDRFVAARLEQEGLVPAAEASREALLRRVSLDLIGLPPAPAEIDAFLADTRPDAYERVVDRLLASPHYGERWARPWLDLARYADSHGYEKDGLRVMWKYRDWVIAALNADTPFDRFTIEQIAGDMLPDATRDQIIATGFHRNTLLNQEGGIDVEEARWETLVDRVNTTATVWLGSTIACAQCHDHKYDPFSQRDYYRLLAFFDNVEYTIAGKTGGDRYIREPELDLPTPAQAARRDEMVAELKTLEDAMSAPNPEVDAAQPAWEQSVRASDEAWTVIRPDTARADHATLTPQPDGSLLASGPHPGVDRYRLEGRLPPGRLTAVRLEALPDERLPQGGPGRDPYGNFLLNGFAIELLSPSGPARALALTDAAADDSTGGDIKELIGTASGYRSGNLPPGWAIDATRDDPPFNEAPRRLRRQAVFLVDGPASAAAGATVAVTLQFTGANVGQALGRFRLSVTDADRPLTAVEVGAKTRALLSIPPGARTEEQRKAIRTQYRGLTPALAAVRDRISALRKELQALGIVTALVMKERPSHERPSTPFRERGAFLSPGERVHAATPEVLPPMADDLMPNRLGLARWLVSGDNPLTSRVSVNRAWEQFFGRGLVETSEDFGTEGAPPTHPELLDWLATEFVRLGWSRKALHRLIVTSATYRQDAKASPSLLEADPDNRLLARGPRVRMEAEMIRDVALAASGLLSLEIGGPSVFPPQPDGIWDNPYSNAKWVTSRGADRHRRGLYTFLRRTAPYPSLMTFDATSREVCTVRRVRTNTPLQALTLLNDDVFFEAARALAARAEREAPAEGVSEPRLRARAVAAYALRLCTSRRPSEQDVDAIVASYERQLAHFAGRPSEAARVAGEASGSDRRTLERAAWTMVANALLNLDETVSK